MLGNAVTVSEHNLAIMVYVPLCSCTVNQCRRVVEVLSVLCLQVTSSDVCEVRL